MKKRVLFILTLVLLFSICLFTPVSAYADSAAPVATAGEIVTGIFTEVVAQIVLPALKALLVAIASAVLIYIARVAGRLAGKYINTKIKQGVAKSAMLWVEQKVKDVHGPAKLRKALEKAQTWLARYGIPFDAEEMEDMIEAALGEFNAAYKKELARTEELIE